MGTQLPYTEDDLLPISALSQLLYCERRCALIHLEGAWDDNRYTVEGTQLHERVHEQGNESRGDLRIARGLLLHSLRLGLSGIADVVEFRRVETTDSNGRRSGTVLPGIDGYWRPFPVEYKRGKPKPDRSDEVQLCAQALCLEEMLSVCVADGALYYGQPNRRQDVSFDDALRRDTTETAVRLHRLIESRTTPTARRSARCRHCSLASLCLPEATSGRSAARYLRDALSDSAHCLPEDD